MPDPNRIPKVGDKFWDERRLRLRAVLEDDNVNPNGEIVRVSKEFEEFAVKFVDDSIHIYQFDEIYNKWFESPSANYWRIEDEENDNAVVS